MLQIRQHNESQCYYPAKKRNCVLSLLLKLTVGFSGLAGCDRDPMIRVYDVPRDATAVAKNEVTEPKRFLIAIIPNGDRAFFIKASDAPRRLDSFMTPLRLIAQDMKVDSDGKPIWKLPETWQAQPGSGMATAILEAPSDGAPIRFVVTELPMPASKADLEGYLESNINRWRGQLGLPPNSIAEQKLEIVEVARQEEALPAYLLDLTGSSSMSGMTSMSPLNRTTSLESKSPAPITNATKESPSRKSSVKYKIPDGWTDLGGSGMREASFALDGDKSKGEVTVIFAGGDRLSNVERWQGQLNPKAESDVNKVLSQEAIVNATEVKTANGIVGQLYSLLGPEGENQPAMLAAIFPAGRGESSVFVKLTGSVRLAQENRDKLVAFLESLEW